MTQQRASRATRCACVRARLPTSRPRRASHGLLRASHGLWSSSFNNEAHGKQAKLMPGVPVPPEPPAARRVATRPSLCLARCPEWQPQCREFPCSKGGQTRCAMHLDAGAPGVNSEVRSNPAQLMPGSANRMA
eukprot:NODE_2885_length_859_cov_318.205224.p2 GENE.NODE_2885_length_859_cov_318.205224~~NODE_2885_length_859_cov_318.205224.p2  ORF type:complete len:155 (-),score=43.21 NODE_2885_length_859_cov_318.205224:379-777(-)